MLQQLVLIEIFEEALLVVGPNQYISTQLIKYLLKFKYVDDIRSITLEQVMDNTINSQISTTEPSQADNSKLNKE